MDPPLFYQRPGHPDLKPTLFRLGAIRTAAISPRLQCSCTQNHSAPTFRLVGAALLPLNPMAEGTILGQASETPDVEN